MLTEKNEHSTALESLVFYTDDDIFARGIHRFEADLFASRRGAVSFFDENYPLPKAGVSFRYYFNNDGLEVGHYIYDLRCIHIMTPPRKWGISHPELRPLSEEFPTA